MIQVFLMLDTYVSSRHQDTGVSSNDMVASSLIRYRGMRWVLVHQLPAWPAYLAAGHGVAAPTGSELGHDEGSRPCAAPGVSARSRAWRAHEGRRRKLDRNEGARQSATVRNAPRPAWMPRSPRTSIWRSGIRANPQTRAFPPRPHARGRRGRPGSRHQSGRGFRRAADGVRRNAAAADDRVDARRPCTRQPARTAVAERRARRRIH